MTAVVGVAGGPSAAAGSGASAAVGAALVPLPVVVEHDPEAAPFVLSRSLAVVARGGTAHVGEQLAVQLRRATGFRVPVRAHGGGNTIRITVDPAADYTVGGALPAAESYVLDVRERGVEITARTEHGAFNGVQTLRQLLPAWAESATPVVADWRVPAIHVEDAPRFSYRGIMLDVARSFQDVEEVKRHIDVLSALKMSVLHLHLADDQGWRIEITNEGKAPGDPIDYTALTRESGVTAMAERGYRNELGRSGHYTQAQYREIVAYARDRFVTVVPEVDVPGHTNAVLHAIPQLNTERSLPARNPETGVVDWNGTAAVGYSALDERLDLTYTFVEHVFGQLAELTGGPYVHLGGDESHAMGHTRFVDFVTRAVPRVQAATGVGTMGWTEYAEAGLAQGPGYWDGSVVQYWIGSGDWVRDFVAKGGKAIVSPASTSYLDQKYNPTTPIGLSWACKGICDFERYYGWDPTTTVSGGLPESGLLGVEGPLWSETVRGGDQAQFLMMPRAAAILEIGWTSAARKDITDFTTRLGLLGPRLTVAGANFHESPGARWATTVAGTDATARRGATARHAIGLVAAPGTTLSADGSQILSATALTATATCGRRVLPVTFTQRQAAGPVHATGLYTAGIEAAFTKDTECVLTPSTGDPVTVRVRVSDRDLSVADASGTPTLSIGTPGAAVRPGTWVPLTLTGFTPGYVDIRIDDTTAYTVRTGPDGRFTRTGLIPATTPPGSHTISAVQGDRSASVPLTVASG
ncbi:family 20 glycosylhydrolase [Actinokineospora sp. 24-640]